MIDDRDADQMKYFPCDHQHCDHQEPDEARHWHNFHPLSDSLNYFPTIRAKASFVGRLIALKNELVTPLEQSETEDIYRSASTANFIGLTD